MAEAPYVVHRTIGPRSHLITLRFEWHGGQYVDVREKGRSDVSEVINVWNAEKDAPTIERTQSALATRVDEWIRDYSEEGPLPEASKDWAITNGHLALYHDVTRNWH